MALGAFGPFLPPRTAIGSSILRFFGRPEQPQLAFHGTVIPTKDLGPELPGVYASPQREVWIAGGVITGVAAQFASLRVWAAPATFATADSRVGTGVYILHWECRLTGGNWPGATVGMGVNLNAIPDPGAGAAAGNVIINSAGGAQFTAGGEATSSAGTSRSPRAQVNMQSTAVANNTLARWPVRSTTEAPSFRLDVPIYVPPGFVWEVQSTTLNQSFAVGCVYVEAEELPIPPPFA